MVANRNGGRGRKGSHPAYVVFKRAFGDDNFPLQAEMGKDGKPKRISGENDLAYAATVERLYAFELIVQELGMEADPEEEKARLMRYYAALGHDPQQKFAELETFIAEHRSGQKSAGASRN